MAEAVLDRLIAAQAIARDPTMIMRNGRDSRWIEGLKPEELEPLRHEADQPA